jgi:hypothetical protein
MKVIKQCRSYCLFIDNKVDPFYILLPNSELGKRYKTIGSIQQVLYSLKHLVVPPTLYCVTQHDYS